MRSKSAIKALNRRRGSAKYHDILATVMANEIQKNNKVTGLKKSIENSIVAEASRAVSLNVCFTLIT
jgi:hypothetical protein